MGSRGTLTPEQLEHHWKHGYVVARGLLGAEDLQRWVERLEDIVAGRVPAAERMLVMRDVMAARGAVPRGAPRPGQPDYVRPRTTRRS